MQFSKTSLLFGLLSLLNLPALSQTRPTSDQLRDVEQARVPCPCDTRPGTFIPTDQLSDERYVGTDSTGAPTVCIVIWERVTYEDGTGFNYHHPICYTQPGLALLLMDPAWKAWWDAQ